MHDCQKFREDWLAASAEGSVDCVECSSLLRRRRRILLAAAAAAPPVPELSEEYWNRLRSSPARNVNQEKCRAILPGLLEVVRTGGSGCGC
jgi:hypothetical protein